MQSSSLSSVVSDLVRASMGSAVPKNVTDDDLDRHIGEIILREAKQKAERYKKDGIRAYLPATDPNVPRPNKRFLSSIIRSTDDHNKAVLRSQAVAAAELKEERDEQERRERMARADEAAQDRLRRLMSGGRRGATEDRWRPDKDGRDRKRRERSWDRESDWARDKSRSRSREKSQERKRYWDEDEDEYRSRLQSSRRRHREADDRSDHRRRRRRRSSPLSRSPRRDKEKSERRSRSPNLPQSSDGDSARSHRRRGRSPSPSHSSRKGKCTSHSSTRIKPSDDTATPRRHRRHHLSSSRSRSPRRDKHTPKPLHPHTSTTTPESSRHRPASSRSRSPRRDQPKSKPPIGTESLTRVPAHSAPEPMRSPNSTPGPPSRTPSPPPISSKMDKYFAPTYDPRLDVAPLASSSGLTVDVPATGLVDNAQFEGWDAMLELIRIRREDRAEKKRLERLGLLPDKEAKGGRGKKGQGMVSAAAEDGKGVMEIEYKKKGAVREWDMGKEGF